MLNGSFDQGALVGFEHVADVSSHDPFGHFVREARADRAMRSGQIARHDCKRLFGQGHSRFLSVVVVVNPTVADAVGESIPGGKGIFANSEAMA
jgi:hypothetical protein